MKQSKTLNFIKRNAVYLVLAICIVAIGLTLTFALVNKQNNLSNDNAAVDQIPNSPSGDLGNTNKPNDENPSGDANQSGDSVDKPVDLTISFIIPVENATSVLEYSDKMVFNSTLNRYSAHLAIDFFAPENTKVFAVYDGTVESVTNSLLKGTTITIDHGNGLKTVYNSLAEEVSVTEGQSVKQGDVIGLVSTTNRQEYKEGSHLHFEVLEDGKSIDPSKYLKISEK